MFVYVCVKSYSLINRAGIQSEQTLVILFFPWQHIYSDSDNVIGSWLFFSVDQMTSPAFFFFSLIRELLKPVSDGVFTRLWLFTRSMD